MSLDGDIQRVVEAIVFADTLLRVGSDLLALLALESGGAYRLRAQWQLFVGVGLKVHIPPGQ